VGDWIKPVGMNPVSYLLISAGTASKFEKVREYTLLRTDQTGAKNAPYAMIFEYVKRTLGLPCYAPSAPACPKNWDYSTSFWVISFPFAH
jgi:hypothetical protein